MIPAKALTLRDLYEQLQGALTDLEWAALQAQPENDEENPYVALAKQQAEKLEAKRKKVCCVARCVVMVADDAHR